MNIYNLKCINSINNTLFKDNKININKFNNNNVIINNNIFNNIINLSYSIYLYYDSKYPFIELFELTIDLYISKQNNKKYRICINQNCYKQAGYNYENETKRLYCSIHQLNNMSCVKNYKKCIDCKKVQPTYNIIGSSVPEYCYNCSLKYDNMVDIKHVKCLESKCTTRPSFNYIDSKLPLYCASHKKENMVDMVSSMCIEDGCIKNASNNIIGEKKRVYCVEHSKNKDNLINKLHKFCIKCGKYANFNLSSKLIPEYCKSCASDNMVDVRHKKCKILDCNTQVNTRYKGYCFQCYIDIFTEHKIVRNYKIKEKNMTDFIKQQFLNLNITIDKPIIGGSSQRRPDVFIKLHTHCIIVECDEGQHNREKYLNDYEYRNNLLIKDANCDNIVFIRYNPDVYINKDNKKVLSCFKLTRNTGKIDVRSEKELYYRLNTLKETIEYYLNFENIKDKIKIIKLFYDNI